MLFDNQKVVLSNYQKVFVELNERILILMKIEYYMLPIYVILNNIIFKKMFQKVPFINIGKTIPSVSSSPSRPWQWIDKSISWRNNIRFTISKGLSPRTISNLRKFVFHFTIHYSSVAMIAPTLIDDPESIARWMPNWCRVRWEASDLFSIIC